MLSKTDKPYLAGIIDGEGCISIAKNHPLYKRGKVFKRRTLYSLEMTITSTNPILLLWLERHLKGRKVAGQRNGWQKCYNWRCTSRQHILEVLNYVEPFLKVKKKQAELARGFIKLGRQSVPDLRETFYRRMRYLNSR